MVPSAGYEKKILLVEDLERFYTPITRWLREEGYGVTLATTQEEALQALDSERHHLAIVDIRLDDGDVKNVAGMDLLKEIESKQLHGVMPCIVLTAYENFNNILVATQERRVDRYIQKETGYRTDLLRAIRELFREKIKINFDLVYDGDSDELIHSIASDINWSMGAKPQLEVLKPQVRDLFGKLFLKARRLYISKLKPGLTGAAIVRIQPTWEHGLGPSYVAKIGRRDKVTTEHENYEEYVKRYLPPNTIAQVAMAYTQYIGALLYTFAENDLGPLEEFDDYYQRAKPEAVAASLRSLFQNTCRYWYDSRQRSIEDLPRLYYRAFQLDEQKLVGRILTVLPHFDPERETFQFNRIPLVVTNPVAWVKRHHHEFVLPVYHSITHGDLTGRNIMVDEANKCWLIDFYRTYDSHILRDFVILESDIKYRLMPKPSLEDFIVLEEALLKASQNESLPALDSDLPTAIRKAAIVIAQLRNIAHDFSRSLGARRRDSYREYLISILMATLNVVRLRHIEEDRKLQAMLSASLICNELDKLAGREPAQAGVEQYRKPHTDSQAAIVEPLWSTNTTAQQRFLIEHFRTNNLILFTGSSIVTGATWPSPAQFAWEVAAFRWPAIYTTNQHTYLEEAYGSRQIPYQVILSPGQPVVDTAEKIPIYKLYGRLSGANRDGLPVMDPITGSDHRNQDTQLWLQQFLTNLAYELNQGKVLLMLYASEDELALIHKYCRTPAWSSAMWIVGTGFSEKQQDIYRGLNFRILVDDPAHLLSVLATAKK